MFSYSKPLFYPVQIEFRDPVFAQKLLEHYGGKDGEYSAATQYLNHRSNMNNRYLRDLLGMIAAEEMGHMEMIAVVINKLGGSPLSYVNSKGIIWNTSYVDQTLDPNEMLQADIEAEIRARILYNHHSTMTHDSGLKNMLSFLGKREDVHKRLLLKAQRLIQKGAPLEQFNQLIIDYKMSLKTTERK